MMIQDIPILVVRGYILRGLPEPVAALKKFRETIQKEHVVLVGERNK